MRALAILVLMACLCLGGEVSLCDFDTGEPTDGWKIRNLSVSEITTPKGRGLKIQSAARGYVARSVAPVTDWRIYEAFAMQVKVEGGPIQMRVRAMRGDNAAALLCRFTLEAGDWGRSCCRSRTGATTPSTRSATSRSSRLS